MINPFGFPYQPGVIKSQQELTPAQKKTQQTCTDFEKLMIQKMLESVMSDTKLFGTGFGSDFYQGMFEEAIAESIAKQGGMGLGKMLDEQLQKDNQPTSK